MLTRDSPDLESTGRSRWHARPGGRTPPARVLGDARRPARNRGGRQPIPGRLRLVRDRACVFLRAPGRLPVCVRARVSRRVAGSRCRLVQPAVLGYFSALLGFAVGLAAASLLPVDVQFGGFWVIAILAALFFYWTLQRWHRKLDWGPGSMLGGSGVGGFARPGIRVFHWRQTHGLWRFVLSPTFVSRWRHGSEMPDSTFGSRSRFSVGERTLSARAERA